MTPEVLVCYTNYLRAANASARTIEARTQAARRLLALAGTFNPEQVTFMDALCFIGSVEAKTSRATYYQHVKAFGRFCHASGYDVSFDRHLPPLQFPRGVPRPADTDQLRAAIEGADERAAMMLRLASLAGLRVSEIARVRGEDVGDVLYVVGKGGRAQMIPAHPSIVEHAEVFPVEGWWFPNPEGMPLSRWRVWDVMTRALRAAGCPSTPHQCRHWYGTALIESGADLRTAQTLLRHASLATTEVYTRVTDQRRVVAVAALPTLG